jgi:hypothetical protein
MTEHNVLRTLIAYFDIQTNIPTTPENDAAPIEGMSLLTGFVCSICSSVFPDTDQLRKHAKAKHPTSVLDPKATHNSVPVQRFRTGKNVKYFVVRLREKAQERDAVDQAIRSLADLLRPAAVHDTVTASADVRNICPWLRHVRWQDLVDGQNIADVRRLVAYPSEDEFPGLAEAVKAVFLKASKYFTKTPDLILQHINSPDENQ